MDDDVPEEIRGLVEANNLRHMHASILEALEALGPNPSGGWPEIVRRVEEAWPYHSGFFGPHLFPFNRLAVARMYRLMVRNHCLDSFMTEDEPDHSDLYADTFLMGR